MPFQPTDFPGLTVFEPRVWGDERGYFFESYNEKTFAEAGLHARFVQDNQARSSRGVLRGLHFQKGLHAQTKLIRALEGEILDVVVDMRKSSPAYGKVYTIVLSAENKKQLWVPKGFAHGYAVLSATAEVFYKCDEFYHPGSEGGIRYDDPSLQIDWRIDLSGAVVSPKDQLLPVFQECLADHFA